MYLSFLVFSIVAPSNCQVEAEGDVRIMFVFTIVDTEGFVVYNSLNDCPFVFVILVPSNCHQEV